MIDPHDFAKKQAELTVEFAKYVLENPAVDDELPEDAYVYFEVANDDKFNAYSRELALRRQREEGMAVVCVRIQGLAPLQGSRLIDPQITPTPSIA